MKTILVIAGSDSSGGAGIQADIKTITSLGGHVLSAVTALTAQNSLGVLDIYDIPAAFVSKQIEAVVEDVKPDAVKIGMLSHSDAVIAIATLLEEYRLSNVVLDPVMRATTGRTLLDPKAVSVMKRTLFPLVDVVTPNLSEAELLSGQKVATLEEARQAAESIYHLGPKVVITGGHFPGRCSDILYDGRQTHEFVDTRISTENTHGTGCVFSSALAAGLAEKGNIFKAVKLAHDFVRRALINGYPCGRGAGCVSPWGERT